MNFQEQRTIESSVPDTNKVRRTFLKRTTAGALIAFIPGRSAWAGIAGSIVASGNSSDFNQGESTRLQNKDYFRDNVSDIDFSDIFGSKPFNKTGNIKKNDLTFKKILNSKRTSQKGVNDVNVALVVLYLNAIYSDSDGNINYPVLNNYNGDDSAFAQYLFQAAISNPGQAGTDLWNIINTYD